MRRACWPAVLGVWLLGVGLPGADAATSRWQDDCVFSRRAGNTTSAECSFKSVETIIRQDVTVPIESLRITRGKSVHLDRGALYNFKHLRSIYLTGMEILNIRFNSLSAIKKQNAISLTVDRVEIVSFAPGALSDWQNPDSTMVLKNLRQLTLSKHALAPNSTFKQVTVENVFGLLMEKGSIQADIGHLRMQNVTLAYCQSHTFNGRIRHMSWVSVSSVNVKSGCIKGKTGWRSLSVRSSHLDHIRTSGIQGAIEDVVIENSHLGSIESGGLELRVSRFSLSFCDVGELKASALKVWANLTISLHSLRVNKLQGNALLGLRIPHSRGQRRPGGQRPQVCLSALTADSAAKNALQLDTGSPVSLYGRVCPSEAGRAQGKQCISGGGEALASLKAFRSKCCFEGVGSRSPVCPSYHWVPYVAAAAGIVMLTAIALFCFMRKLRAKRWQVARRAEHSRISTVPGGDYLENNASGIGSPHRLFRYGDSVERTGPGGKENAFEKECGTAVDAGPLASWLQTLRDTVPPHPGWDSAKTIELVEGGATEERPDKSVLQGKACSDHRDVLAGTEAGSDTESVIHDDRLAQSKKTEEARQKDISDAQPPEEQLKEVGVPDLSSVVAGQQDKYERMQDRSKKETKTPGPKRPPRLSLGETHQSEEREQPMPVYAQVHKRKPALSQTQQGTSTETSSDNSTSLSTFRLMRTDNTIWTTSKEQSSADGGRRLDVVYADVFNSLPKVPSVDPAVSSRQKPTAGPTFHADVHHALNAAKPRRPNDPGPDATLRLCPDEYDETDDDLPSAAKIPHRGPRTGPGESVGEESPLTRCPLYDGERDTAQKPKEP